MNVQFVPKSLGIEREARQKGTKTSYWFYYQIINGFELAKSFKPKEGALNTRVALRIGAKDPITTGYREGHYP